MTLRYDSFRGVVGLAGQGCSALTRTVLVALFSLALRRRP